MFVLHLLISMLTSSDPVVGEVGSENFNVYEDEDKGVKKKASIRFLPIQFPPQPPPLPPSTNRPIVASSSFVFLTFASKKSFIGLHM